MVASNFSAGFGLVRRQFADSAKDYLSCPIQSNDFTLPRIVELIKPKMDWRAVDIATGAGHMASAISPHVGSVLATDITPEMLEAARSLTQSRRQKNVILKVADCTDIPAESSYFDLATCRLAVHHFKSIDTFMQEARRLLKDKGVLGIVDSHLPNNDAFKEINKIQGLHDPSHVKCLTRVDFEAALARNLFELKVVEEGSVRIGFRSWVKRKPLSNQKISQLRRMMCEESSPDTAAMLKVQADPDEDFYFSFQRIIIVAQKIG